MDVDARLQRPSVLAAGRQALPLPPAMCALLALVVLLLSVQTLPGPVMESGRTHAARYAVSDADMTSTVAMTSTREQPTVPGDGEATPAPDADGSPRTPAPPELLAAAHGPVLARPNGPARDRAPPVVDL